MNPRSPLSGARIFVAGGAGFIGSALVRDLASRGAVVTCFDNFLHGTMENVVGLTGVVVESGDANDTDAVVKLLRRGRFDMAVNCMGDTFVTDAYDVPERFVANNVMSTLSLLVALRSARVGRLLHVSTTEVYGDRGDVSLDETTPLDPVNTYAVTKAAGDRLCHTAAIEHRQQVLIARLFNSYGPRETHPYVVPEIISQLHSGSLIELGDLTAMRDLTYVDDTAAALSSLLCCDLPSGEVVNVGSGTCYSVRDLVTLVAEVMGVGDVHVRSDPARIRRREIAVFKSDSSKLRAVTGWRPQVSIATGLRRTVAWYRENGYHWPWEPSPNLAVGVLAQQPPRRHQIIDHT